MMIYVCNLREMPLHAETLCPAHLMSLVPEADQPPTPSRVPAARHLRLAIDDISEPLEGYVLPQPSHIHALVRFTREWDEESPMLIHCVAGISRSTAAALIALVVRGRGNGREIEAAQQIRAAAPHAEPNRRMIALADQLLGCNGRLIMARETMGPATSLPYGPLVHLALPR